MASAMRMARTASSTLVPSRDITSSNTGLPVRIERPRSPWTTWDSHVRNWIGSGRSSPISARSWAASAALRFSPPMASIGSPGTRCRKVNVKRETTRRLSGRAARRPAT
jgi:hypothetical protein